MKIDRSNDQNSCSCKWRSCSISLDGMTVAILLTLTFLILDLFLEFTVYSKVSSCEI